MDRIESDAADREPDGFSNRWPAVVKSDLDNSLADLSRLSPDWVSLEDLLTQVAKLAERAIPGADGAGLTLLEADRADVLVMSEPFVGQIDALQYGIQEGPCLSAAASGRTMCSGALGGDPRWPRFGPRAGRLGVHSVLSLPLLATGGTVGTVNVYAHAKDAFDDRSTRLGEMFAGPAAVSVRNAQILAQARRLAAQTQAAMASRGIIDQAIGILRSRSGVTGEEAFDRLRLLSQNERTKLTEVAGAVVEEAVRRAKARKPTAD